MGNSDTAMWVIFVAVLIIAGWAGAVFTGADWLFADSSLFSMHANLFSTQLRAGAVPAMKDMIYSVLEHRGVEHKKPIRKALDRYLDHPRWLSEAVTTFCSPTVSAYLHQFCDNYYHAWIAGAVMTACIGVACLTLLIGCVAVLRYAEKPSQSGWCATVFCFSVPPVLLFLGNVLYSVMVQSFGQDEFGEFGELFGNSRRHRYMGHSDMGHSDMGRSGMGRGVVGRWLTTGYLCNLVLSFLSVVPLLIVAGGMKRKKDDEDEPMGRGGKQPMYGATPAGVMTVGPVHGGMPGMMQPQQAGMYSVQVTTEEFTQAAPVQTIPQAQRSQAW